jgi:putative ABC transport system permease protein
VIRSAILSFYRSLLRHPLYAALNLLGLAFGIAVFILLSLFVRFETSYDTWLPGADHIYAVTYNTTAREAAHQPAHYSSAGYVLDAIRAAFPDALGTRIDAGYLNVRSGSRVYAEDGGQSVDTNVFKVFDVPVVAGDRDAALNAPDGVLLSERMAKKYFGRTDVLGRILYIRDDSAPPPTAGLKPAEEKAQRVLAILRDAPANATLHFDIVRLRRSAPTGRYWFSWGSQAEIRTYFRLDPKMHDRLAAGLVPSLRAYMPVPSDKLAQTYFQRFFTNTKIRLAPFNSEHLADTRARRALAAVDLAGLLAFFVSLINYVNLATARAGLRAREVAMRKAAGATRTALVIQFLAEALLLGMAALFIAFSLVELCLPVINGLGHLSLDLDYTGDGPILLALAAGVLSGSAVAGLYPAMVLSGIDPAQALSSAKAPGGGRRGRMIREGLAVVQFVATTAFFIIIAGLAVQIRHLETAKLGYTRDGLLITNSLVTHLMRADRALAIQEAWRQTPGITAVASGPTPGRYFLRAVWPMHRKEDAREIDVHLAWMQGDFFGVYQTTLLAGRQLDDRDDLGRLGVDPLTDDMRNAGITANADINLSAVKALGLASPDAALNHTVTLGNTNFRVVGVVADQRFQSPTKKQLPALYVYSAPCVLEDDTIIGFAGIDETTARQRVEAVWRDKARDLPFEMTSAHDALDFYYADDRRNTRLFAVGGGIAGLIGAVGLFGMAAFNTSARIQEIAVRKVFGASRRRVAGLLVLQLLRPVLIANVLAWPVAYVVLAEWLKPFEDRVSLSPLLFLAGSGLSLLIAAATVLSVALAAVRLTPAAALRQV